MVSLDDIKAPIDNELQEFQKRFCATIKSDVFLLDKITTYMLKKKGKQMRPIFVFFSAKLCGGITDKTHRAAGLVELLHTATLVHDDVVDDSHERRGLFSINALWKNKIAVLVGDYLLSKGMLFTLENNDFNLLRIVSNAVKEMSEGELLQLEKARRLNISEDIYFEIIRKKTASLLASCCATGAASAEADEKTVENMRVFGEYVGIAFQLKDDLFDFQKNNATGKPVGVDLKEQKMTLPVICALNNCSGSEKRHIINIVKNHNTNTEKIAEVIDLIEKYKGFDYTKNKMYDYRLKALSILSENFKDNPAKQSLEQLVSYTIERNL